MKYLSINTFIVIIILHTIHQPLYGMLLRRASSATSKPMYYRGSTRLNPRTFRSKPDSSVPIQKETFSQKLPQTPPSTTFFSRTQQWLQGWWDKGKTKVKQKIVGQTAQDIIEEIRKNPLKAMDTFDTFIIKNNPNAVGELLDELIILGENNKDNEIEFLELVITSHALNPKIDSYIIIEKMINWASERIIDLLKTPTTQELVVYLLSLDSNKKLASEIVRNYEFIGTTEAGSRFINLIMRQQPKNVSDTSQHTTENLFEKIKKMTHEKWNNILSSIEKKYDIPAPSVLKKKSLEQWRNELDKAGIDLKQRINDKKAQEAKIARERITKE